MNQMYTPEATLSKAQGNLFRSCLEFCRTGEDENALMTIHDFFNGNKKKNWTPNHQTLITLFIELAIKSNKLKILKDGLNFYKIMTQTHNLESFTTILNKTKETVEEKFESAQKNYKNVHIDDLHDLDSDDSPELFLLYSFDEGTEMKEKKQLINCQKFIWETYKILLDITKTNSKLLTLYSKILISAFNFCKTNKRKVEFKRLCDSVRGYLQTLIKTEKKQLTIVNKVDISKPQVLKILIDIRLSLLETATVLEQWQEAFKTAEDLVFLMDRYEKIPLTDNPKKNLKINLQKKLDFYVNVERLLWISDYHMYNAYAAIIVKDLSLRIAKAYADLLGNPTSSKHKLDIYKRYSESYPARLCNDRIVLSSLCCPLKNQYTNFLKLGEELFDNNQEKEIESETCSRMMIILKLNYIPSRQNLMTHILSHNVAENCSPAVKELFRLFENEENPFKLAKNGFELIQEISASENNVYEPYCRFLKQNIIVKSLLMFGKIYESVSFDRVLRVFPGTSFKEIENLIVENSRLGVLTCMIDYSNNLVLFKNTSFHQINLNEHFSTIHKGIYDIGRAILTEDKTIVKNLQTLKNSVYNSLRKLQENGKISTDERLNKISKTIESLANYHKQKEEEKQRRKEEKLKEKQKSQMEEEENMKKALKLLKDEEAKKELQRELKKHLLDKLKSYTNVIELKGIKYRIDDLLKDLDKIEDNEILVQILEKEEVDYKTQKEKKINKTIKEKDYITRELREREYKAYYTEMTKEEKSYLEELEKKDREYHSSYVPMKADLISFNQNIGQYFDGKIKEIEEEHARQMEIYRVNKLETIRKEIDQFAATMFLNTIEMYIKKWKQAEREKLEKEKQPSGEAATRLEKPEGFVRKQIDSTTIEAPKKEEVKNLGFASRGTFVDNKPKEETKEAPSTGKIGFQRGIETGGKEMVKPVFKDETKDKPTATTTTTGFGRREEPKIEKNVKEPAKTEEKTIGFNRGVETKQEKPAENKPVFSRGTETTKKTEEKPAEVKPTITRGGEQKKEETKTVETKAGFSRGVETKKTEETKPAFSRGAETTKKAEETKPAFSRGGDTNVKKPEENKQASSTQSGFGRKK